MSKSLLEQQFKQKSIDNSSEEFKKNYRLKTLDEIFKQLGNRENRILFYCPDIPLVNDLTKIIYNLAYTLEKYKFNVTIIHEIHTYKCKWLIDEDRKYNKLKVDYFIKKKGSKTKKTSNNYSFKPSDTLIVPDQFIEIFDNLNSVKLIHKVVLFNSLGSLSSLSPGIDFNSLKIDTAIFLNKTLEDLYSSLFTFKSKYLLEYNYVDYTDVKRDSEEVLPLISLSNIGNVEFVNQVINVFYNKYPYLRIFNFRILDRNNYSLYKENFEKSCLILALDKTLNGTVIFDEAAKFKIPIITNKRPELNEEYLKLIYAGDTCLEIADAIAEFCSYWLNTFTKEVDDSSEDYIEKPFEEKLLEIFKALTEERALYFKRIKESV